MVVVVVALGYCCGVVQLERKRRNLIGASVKTMKLVGIHLKALAEVPVKESMVKGFNYKPLLAPLQALPPASIGYFTARSFPLACQKRHLLAKLRYL